MEVDRDPRIKTRPWPIAYGAAVVATIVAVLLRAALTPLIGENAVPFITFFPAVLFAAWYGGFSTCPWRITQDHAAIGV